MPVDEVHRAVAATALRAAARYGFALGGGNALIAYGLIDRPTQDVDLFTDREHGVRAAAGAVETALRGAGYTLEREDSRSDLADIFDGLGDGLAEWLITGPDGAQMMLQMAYFERDRRPVTMDLGPVLDLEDVVGWKVVALALLTELRTRSFRMLGQQRRSVTRFRARDLWGKRNGPSRADCAARWEVARDG